MPITNYLPSSRLIQPGVCTSSTRPVSPFEGQAIFEVVSSYTGFTMFPNVGTITDGTARVYGYRN
jgi:hypothetical protein